MSEIQVANLWFESSKSTGIIGGTSNNTFTIRTNSIDQLVVNTSTTYARGSVVANSGWAGTGRSSGKLGGIVQAFACERNGTGVVGQVLSFGNGSSALKGIRMPYSGKLMAATLSGVAVTGTITVDAYLNGAANTSYRLTQTNGVSADVGVTQDFQASPLTFSANDTLGWYLTAAPSAATGFIVNFYVIFD